MPARNKSFETLESLDEVLHNNSSFGKPLVVCVPRWHQILVGSWRHIQKPHFSLVCAISKSCHPYRSHLFPQPTPKDRDVCSWPWKRPIEINRFPHFLRYRNFIFECHLLFVAGVAGCLHPGDCWPINLALCGIHHHHIIIINLTQFLHHTSEIF